MKKGKKTNQCLNLREAMRKITTRGSTNTISLNTIKMQAFSNITWSSSSKASIFSMSNLLACKFSIKLSLRTCSPLKLNTLKSSKLKEQDMLAREIQEVKKYQVNQTLLGNQKGSMEKLEQSMVLQQKEITEMNKQIKD
ncbi:hypothetical protein PIB30_082770 [Stylosanthes scabra]|uniref:Uncharacterized protein n=1 Tax=Stylosanthes scabra TaxID=79078 RepID=A0ABU6RSC6_9FABA|nr:hypothetical protein [Stylosanthes scabra]